MRFEFVASREQEEAIRITEDGPYKNLVLSYGPVRFEPIENSEECGLKFEYILLDNPNNVEDNTPELVEFLGDVLVELIDHSIETDNLIFDSEDVDGHTGKNNSTESDSE
tara:strand:+ start:77 stop:406 length:330 start_codon:yes stop_codon:yes gene_type:complete